jgi:signal transduction histidine kinase/CheY-like chemotaxis protein
VTKPPATEPGDGLAVALLAPRGRDAGLTRELLENAGFECRCSQTLAGIISEIDRGSLGLVVLVEEAVGEEGWPALARALGRQPAWSDLPVVLFTYRSHATVESAFGIGGNMTLIERPVRRSTLIVAVRSALRTRRRQYELRDLLHRMDELLRRLAETDRRKDEFLAALSHELRTPMAAVRNALEVLRLSLPPAGGHERPLEIIGRQMDNLKRLVDDLLDVSRVTTGKVELNLSTIDMRDIVRRSVQALEAEARAAGHQTTLQVTQRPVWVTGDAVRLEQVVANLITNSIKYTRSGGRIDVTVDREPAAVVVRVRDNGIGIDAEMLPRVFDLFAQASQPLDRKRGGLGVGLHLVRTLVRHHGGSIEANSEGEGRGSEFVVRLPASPAPQALPVMNKHTNGHARSLSIVVVEDNADTREMLVDALRLRGHRVESAGDGLSGLELVLRVHPDVALVDLGLPGIDGFALARGVRAELAEAETRLIAISGYGQPRDRAEAQDAGFDEHLVKPIEIEDLNERLGALGVARSRTGSAN